MSLSRGSGIYRSWRPKSERARRKSSGKYIRGKRKLLFVKLKRLNYYFFNKKI
jgi:hypothetical protein